MEVQAGYELTRDAIYGMDADTLIDAVILLFDLEPLVRAPMMAYVKRQALRLGVAEIIGDLVRNYEVAQDAEEQRYARAIARGGAPVEIERDKGGKAIVSINNFLAVMRCDPFFNDVRYNMLTEAPETMDNGRKRRWEDKDDARARGYIEGVYRIHNHAKYTDAIRQLYGDRAYHPVRDRIEAIQWDGIPRVEEFLPRWVKCADNAYTRECSRLIFAGGIHRIYEPGCKFDDMVVLIGVRQGEGKSTLVRWIALEDEFFREVTEFDGQRGMEAVEGAWICEVGELLALTRVKEQEAVKSFLTRQVDAYRRPYDTKISDHPRQCIFIGTTNKREFVSDTTGGRRFYPVEVGMTGYELFAHEGEIKEYIAQCWAEARHRMLDEADGMPPFANKALIKEIRQMQAGAQEDDYRVGMIERYIDGKDMVCGIELWKEALGEERSPTRKDYADIGAIMQRFEGWERPTGRVYIPKYGQQRVWKVKTERVEGAEFRVVYGDSPDFLPKEWKTKLPGEK